VNIRVYGIWRGGGATPWWVTGGGGGDYIGTAPDTSTGLALVELARRIGCYAVSLHGQTEDGRTLSGEYLADEAVDELIPPGVRGRQRPRIDNYYAHNGREG
jgi:hypothetical protein